MTYHRDRPVPFGVWLRQERLIMGSWRKNRKLDWFRSQAGHWLAAGKGVNVNS